MYWIRPVIFGLFGFSLAAGCGPRAGDSAGGTDRGSAPSITTTESHIPTPVWVLDGPDVTFPIRFVLKARDPDQNMRRVEIDVTYVDTCEGVTQRVELTEDLPSDAWSRVDISVDESTTDRVRVPRVCYPADNLFDVALRVRDFRGNLSNLLRDRVTVRATQGPGAG